MSFKMTGQMKEIFDTKTTDKGFRTREFILYVPGQYEQEIKFQAQGDRCDVLENFKINQNVTITFGISGKSYTNKEGVKNWFNQLVLWQIN